MSHSIEKLYYQEDWENHNTIVVREMANGPKPQWNPQSHSWETITINVNFNLTEFSTDLKVPTEGKHSITIWAVETGSYQEDTGKRIQGLEGINIYTFHITSIKTVTFTVDNSPPEIRILSIENKTYNAPSVPLVFALDKSNTQLSYSIDGLSNRTIAGNSSIAGLQNGNHNVTVYAQDGLGNKGMSETVVFNVDAPMFPLVPIVVASVVTIGLTATGLLVYFRRHKHYTDFS
jgi:predicted phage tail protein